MVSHLFISDFKLNVINEEAVFAEGTNCSGCWKPLQDAGNLQDNLSQLGGWATKW